MTAVVAAAGVLLSAGCSGGDKSGTPSWQSGAEAAAANAPAPASPQPTLSTVAVTFPAKDATGVKAIAEIKYSSEDPANTAVEVKDAAGKKVEGTLDTDEKVFRPAEALGWGKKYTVTVTGTASADRGATATSSFTVMKKPSKLVRAVSHLGDGQTVGVGMPLIIRLDRAVPKKYRADVQRRMQVTATPAQEGIWHWTSGQEVHYRPKVYWKPQTKVSYRVQLKGVPMGDGWYGRTDYTVNVKIGRSFVMTVDNKSKHMIVKQNGKVVKKLPVSLGKPGFHTVSGTMLVTDKLRKTTFNTIGRFTGPDAYNTEVEYAQRLTWGGQFIHAARWSEGSQGRTNVSHGCINVSHGGGKWLYENTMIGDPVTITGTEERIQYGDGWTDWSLSWEEYKKGSAI
ncbi:L,D-transpeptidase [Couchioplanes caeruleus]|nr:Ig-like domain-containing protein [Couchioplanes caeruleus]ROP30557.1 lipoprotein-anchoring transpeptidase ErfK/SrfK [Couchioplanes caeruleus]